MIIFLIGIILVLTAAIVLLCIGTRLSREAHRTASARFRGRMDSLLEVQKHNGALLLANEELDRSLLDARRELDRMLIEAATDRAS